MSSLTSEVRSQQRSECVQEAVIAGAQYGAVGLAAGIALVALASRASPGFQRLNTSAKTALAVSPGAFLFALVGEEQLVECMRDKSAPKP